MKNYAAEPATGQNRLAEAEACYRRAIELEPHNAVAHSSLGVALRQQGRHEEAEACYRRAIEIDPDVFVVVVLFCEVIVSDTSAG